MCFRLCCYNLTFFLFFFQCCVSKADKGFYSDAISLRFLFIFFRFACWWDTGTNFLSPRFKVPPL